MTEYEKRGYANREAYLYWLAITHGLPVKQVTNCAHSLGESEDFAELLVLLVKIVTTKQCIFAARIRTKNRKRAKGKARYRRQMTKKKLML